LRFATQSRIYANNGGTSGPIVKQSESGRRPPIYEGGKEAATAPETAKGTQQLPEINVMAKRQAPKRPASKRAASPQAATAAQAAPPGTGEPTPAEAALDRKMGVLDQSRENFRNPEVWTRSGDLNLLPKLGASTYTIDRDAIVSLPQADNTPIDKVILRLPGVSYDSASPTQIFTFATNMRMGLEEATGAPSSFTV
jgi:hypothetical protein